MKLLIEGTPVEIVELLRNLHREAGALPSIASVSGNDIKALAQAICDKPPEALGKLLG